jgi:hypothetical protein
MSYDYDTDSHHIGPAFGGFRHWHKNIYDYKSLWFISTVGVVWFTNCNVIVMIHTQVTATINLNRPISIFSMIFD